MVDGCGAGAATVVGVEESTARPITYPASPAKVPTTRETTVATTITLSSPTPDFERACACWPEYGYWPALAYGCDRGSGDAAGYGGFEPGGGGEGGDAPYATKLG